MSWIQYLVKKIGIAEFWLLKALPHAKPLSLMGKNTQNNSI
jgi:hypothetical protein